MYVCMYVCGGIGGSVYYYHSTVVMSDVLLLFTYLCMYVCPQSVVDVAESLGLLSFTHPAFGELPTAHAKQ